MSGIATEGCADVGGGSNAAYIDDGDWMDYSINLAAPGTYTAKFRVASPNTGLQLQVKKSDGTVLTTVTVPNTGNWQSWATVDASVTLPAGQQTLRIYALNGYWNFNWWVLLPPVNPAPIVNAGPDQTIILPNTLSLNGSASDANGTISNYSWTTVSGPNNPAFNSANSATTIVSGLVQGTYVFKLTAVDNEGAPGMDDITVTVEAAPVGSTTWLTTGNNNTDENIHFIGTTDLQPLIFKTGGHSWAKLTTDGIFISRKIKVTLDGWSDYVFDSTYKLRPLMDVEHFIKLHKRLPDVPSEKDIVSGGLDVGGNQAVLLKKIEELTLYIIDINKRLEKLSEENAELKKEVRSKIK
jgi:hypothetical protein